MINPRKRRKMRRTSKVWDEPVPAFSNRDPLPIGKTPTKRKDETHSEFHGRLIRWEDRRDKLEQERASLTGAEIDRRLVALLIECGRAAREVTEADIRGLNIPLKEITPARKARCLAQAEEQSPGCTNRIFKDAA